MKNKNRVFRIASLLLVLCFISTVMISGTFAKYTSEYSGQDTALVARWSFVAEGGQAGSLQALGDGTQTLDLFDHAYTQHINQKAVTGNDEKYIIAPGVNGEFVLEMDYLADVDADVEIKIGELEGSVAVPVEYLIVGDVDNWVKLEDLAAALAAKIVGNDDYQASSLDSDSDSDTKFRLDVTSAGTSDSVNIQEIIKWRWAYDDEEQDDNFAIESSDEADTALGKASADAAALQDGSRTSYGIAITLTATQVAPEIENSNP